MEHWKKEKSEWGKIQKSWHQKKSDDHTAIAIILIIIAICLITL